MQNNLLAAIGLSVLVYVLWFGYLDRGGAGPARPPQADSRGSPPAGTFPTEPSTPSGTSPTPTTAVGARDVSGASKTASKEIHTTSVNGHEIRFGSLGGAVTSFRYKGPLGPVQLIPYPEPGFFSTFPDLEFRLIRADSESVVLGAAHPEGWAVEKEYRFGGSWRLNRLRVRMVRAEGGGAPQTSRGTAVLGDVPEGASAASEPPSFTLGLGPGLGTVASQTEENRKLWQTAGLRLKANGKEEMVRKLSAKHASDAFRWLGLENRYFLAALLAPGISSTLSGFTAEDVDLGPLKAPVLRAVLPQSGASASGGWKAEFYFGPKDYGRLKTLGGGLEQSVDFGFFGALGRLTLRSLHFFHGLTRNYGWAIILLTIAIQILIFPLTYKSMKSMAGLRKIQPQLALLQAKYKDDPKRLNLEMMQLYKQSGANPLGGCLPMLLQMPVFFALFSTLQNSWDLHGAPFILWIKDLSAPDMLFTDLLGLPFTLGLLPLLMGGAMFFQQRLSPQATDPMQAKMMMWMPVIFTFMFLNFPAGLVLYWLTSSLLNLAQQTVLKKSLS